MEKNTIPFSEFLEVRSQVEKSLLPAAYSHEAEAGCSRVLLRTSAGLWATAMLDWAPAWGGVLGDARAKVEAGLLETALNDLTFSQLRVLGYSNGAVLDMDS